MHSDTQRVQTNMGFPGGSVVKHLPANAGDLSLIPGSGRPLEKRMATLSSILSFLGGSMVKNPPTGAAGDTGSIPGSGRSPGSRNGDPFQYSCLGNPTDRGAWQATVHGIAESQTRLSG